MTNYLVRISQNRWLRENYPWLPRNGVPGDVYQDLKINQGDISVWRIHDDGSNFDDVVTALTSARGSVAALDYGYFSPKLLEELQIQAVDSPGETPYEYANHWHSDLVHMSVTLSAQLMRKLYRNLKKDRVQKNKVRELLLKAASQNSLNEKLLDASLKQELEKLRARFNI